MSERIYQDIMSISPNRRPYSNRANSAKSASTQFSFFTSPRNSARPTVSPISFLLHLFPHPTTVPVFFLPANPLSNPDPTVVTRPSVGPFLFCFSPAPSSPPFKSTRPKQSLLGNSGGVVNSLDFCPASLNSHGCFYFRCVLSSQWKAVTVNLRILHCQH